MDETDSDEGPHAGHSPPCDKCRLTDCFLLHDYSPSNCPLQICDVCPTLAEIDEEISNAQALLINLAKKRQEIKRKINSRHDCLFSRLPIEVVSHIFKYSAGFNDVYYAKSHLIRTWYPALLLGAVCKSWRDITLGVPHLWTTISINPWKDSTRLDVAKEWLHRSRALPLSISFRGIDPPLNNEDKLTSSKPLLDVVRSHSARWRRPRFDIPPYMLHALLDGLEDIPQVDTLRIDHLALHETPMDAISMREPLRPRDFYASNVSVAKMSFQWDNLTRLQIFFISLDELVHIIRHGTNLIDCKANLIKVDGENYPLPTTPIINHSIQRLETTACPPSINFLRYITLPSLQHFVYSFQTHEHATDILVNFLDRSAAPLGSFTLKYHMDSSYPFEPWAERLPAITHLDLEINEEDDMFDLTDAFFEALTPNSDELILPNLQYLEFVTPWMSISSWSRFASIFSYPGDQEEPNESDSSTLDVSTKDSEGPPDSLDPGHHIPSAAGKRPTRPLQYVVIRQKDELNQHADEIAMDDSTCRYLLDVHDAGVYLELVDMSDMDMLKYAAKYYFPEEYASGSDTSEDSEDSDGSEDGSVDDE